MYRADVVDLIAENPAAHGVLDKVSETLRRVFCEVQSVSFSETYQALATGLNPEYRLIIAHDFEYHGEKFCIFRGVRYRIIRTYVNRNDGIELTIQRTEGNAEVKA